MRNMNRNGVTTQPASYTMYLALNSSNTSSRFIPYTPRSDSVTFSPDIESRNSFMSLTSFAGIAGRIAGSRIMKRRKTSFLCLLIFLVSMCVFRLIRPPIPIDSGHLFRFYSAGCRSVATRVLIVFVATEMISKNVEAYDHLSPPIISSRAASTRSST